MVAMNAKSAEAAQTSSCVTTAGLFCYGSCFKLCCWQQWRTIRSYFRFGPADHSRLKLLTVFLKMSKFFFFSRARVNVFHTCFKAIEG